MAEQANDATSETTSEATYEHATCEHCGVLIERTRVLIYHRSAWTTWEAASGAADADECPSNTSACGDCDGSGSVDDDCSACDGTGDSSDADDEHEGDDCDECDGSGIVDASCDECDGGTLVGDHEPVKSTIAPGRAPVAND